MLDEPCAMGFQNAYWADEQGLWVGIYSISQRTAESPDWQWSISKIFLLQMRTRTLYKDRYSLIAGHFSIAGQSKIHGEMVQSISTKLGKTNSKTSRRLDYLLRRNLSRLFSGTKMGVLLSGGLDSSASTSRSELGYQLDSFTITLESVDADQSPFAGRIAHLYDGQIIYFD